MTSPSVYDTLTTWATAAGTTLNPSVEVKVSPTSGASFFAKSHIPVNVPIVTCPMSLTLSYLNTLNPLPPSFRNPYAPVSPSSTTRPKVADNIPFPKSFLSSAPPYVVSRLLLVQQYLAGPESFWSPYIDSLPQPGALSLPALWDDDEVELLDGTNLGTSVQMIRSTLSQEYEAIKKLLASWTQGNPSVYTFELYQWAYAVFTSRSFTPALVIPDNMTLASQLPDGVSLNDFSLLLPLYDIGNHDMTSPITWTSDSSKQSVTLSINRDHQPGDQIYNNYGNKTNTQLLLAYGFMIPETESLHNDYVHLCPKVKNTSDPPRDYLLSLHPVYDPRSKLVCDKLLVKPDECNKVLAGFSYVEDALLLTLIAAQKSLPDVAAILGIDIPTDTDANAAVEASKEIVKVALTGDVPESLKPVLYQAMGAVVNQAFTEMEKLEETDVEVPEVAMGGLSENQRLALEYRERVRRVLVNVVEHVDEEWMGW